MSAFQPCLLVLARVFYQGLTTACAFKFCLAYEYTVTQHPFLKWVKVYVIVQLKDMLPKLLPIGFFNENKNKKKIFQKCAPTQD